MYLLLSGLVLLIVLSVPVFFAISLSSIAYAFTEGISRIIIAQRMVTGLDSFTLLAIPCFILAGQLMNSSGITDRIFRFARALVGRVHGGLGMANVLASIVFAGMSGASVADIGGLGAVEIKAMKDEGYDVDFSVGITLASSLVGPIIPPSINIILYASQADASVGRLFLAGVVPGLTLGLFLMVQVYLIAKKKGYPRYSPRGFREFLMSFAQGLLPLGMPAIILGGIGLGVFTPTESAVVAVIYALILGILVYRTLDLRKIYDAVVQTMLSTATIALIVAAAATFGWVLTHARIPHAAAELLTSIASSDAVFLALATLLFLVVGCFLDQAASILILTPILMPVVRSFGIDPVHFGILTVFALQVGLLTPPVGLGLYMGSQVGEISIERTLKSVQVFYISCLLLLVLLIFLPELSLGLPNLIMGVT